jgi:hypothetical protein
LDVTRCRTGLAAAGSVWRKLMQFPRLSRLMRAGKAVASWSPRSAYRKSTNLINLALTAPLHDR